MRGIGFLLLALLVCKYVVFSCSSTPLDRDGLRKFLESQYVPEAKLLRAATRYCCDSRTIYIASDNLLASRALTLLESPHAHIIMEELSRYNNGEDNQHEILLGIDIPDDFYEASIITISTIYSKKFNTTFKIKFEIHNESNPIINDWELYADLIVYRALDKLLQGSRSYAEYLFEKLMSMWDGYGFRDKAFNGKYDTYKLALAIYLYRALEIVNPRITMKYRGIIDRCYETIYSLQRDDGGIITNYRVEHGRIIPIGDANTETTSIVTLAIYSNYPITIGRQALRIHIPIIHILLLIVIIVGTVIAVAILFKA